MKRRTFLKHTARFGLGVGLATQLPWIYSCAPEGPSNPYANKPADGNPIGDGADANFVNQLNDYRVGNHPTRDFSAFQDISFEGGLNHKGEKLAYGSNPLFYGFEARKGDRVQLEFTNGLNEATNVHWHGFTVPQEYDGHPSQRIAAGGSKRFDFTIVQDEGLYWFHPHLHEMTASQVYRGLAGLFVVREYDPWEIGLPAVEHELQLVLQDRAELGTPIYETSGRDMMHGKMGPHQLVNGIHKPYVNLSNRLHRFRILNGANSRPYNLELSDQREFYVIGSDSGLLAAPAPVKEVPLGPGERLDLLVDLRPYKPGESVVLRSKGIDQFRLDEQFDLMKIFIDREAGWSTELPIGLPASSAIVPNSTAVDRRFKLTAAPEGGKMNHYINDTLYKMDRVDFTVKANSTEVWEFDNPNPLHHPMHVHVAHFSVIERNGGTNRGILAHERGLKDTVLLLEEEKVKVAIKFPSYKGLFLLHCHVLEHEDHGMMLNFEIAE